MKKILSLLLVALFAFSLFSCKDNNESNYTLNIGYLSGPTGMGMAKMIQDNSGSDNTKYQFKSFSDPNTAVSEILAGKLDIACVPTNTASVLYNKTEGKISVLALNTLGVLHLIENGNTISDISDLEGKTVYASVPGSTTEYIIDHVFKANGLVNGENVTVVYEPDHDALVAKIITGEASLAILPEPKVSAALIQAQNPNLRIAMSMTEEWNAISETPLVQGCIVARKEIIDSHKTEIDNFLAEYKASVEYISAPENMESAAEMIVSTNIIPKLPIAKKALPNSNITYIDGDEMKNTLSAFLNVLHQSNPSSVGGKMPGENFYYEK